MIDNISHHKPLNSLSKSDLWTETIRTWDFLVESGYGPSDFFGGEVKMNYQGFKKLIKKNGNCARVKETRHYRISAVWIGNVEISFTEVKIDKDDWLLENNWSPVE